MSETTAMTTTAVPPKNEGLVHAGGTSYVSTPSARAVTPAPAPAKTIAAMFQCGPGVGDPIPGGPLKGYSRALVDTLKDTVAKGAPDEQLYMFIHQCVEYNLDPTKKEAWCVNMAGQGQAPQWMVAPSRDGYLRMAQRHPNFDQINSGVVREGDHYEIDTVNGIVVHRVNGMKARNGAILGAWCIVTTKDRKRYAHQVLVNEVRRGTKVWENFLPQMVEKAVQSQTLRKAGLFSNLYVTDRVWEAIESDDIKTALLMDPTQPDYVDGFAVGTEPAGLPAGGTATEPAEPSRASRNDGVKALNDRIVAVAATIEGTNQADVIDARNAFLNGKGLPPISKITDAQIVWDLVDVLETEDGADLMTKLVTEARDARWQKEATAREFAEAGQAPPVVAATAETAIDVEVVDAEDDIPSFEKTEGEAADGQ